MIVWIDGPKGIGKSTISKKVNKKLDNESILLESDYYWFKMIEENPFLALGGCYPQNNENFIRKFKEVIESELNREKTENKIIIIDMALTDKKCKEELFDYFKKDNRILHIILTAEKNVIKERIEKDTNETRDKINSIAEIDSSLKFLEENFKDTIKINTNNYKIDEISKTIVEHINHFE